MAKKTFSEELKLWRGARSQVKAAKAIGVPVRTLQGWEIGRKPRYMAGIRAMMDLHPDLS